MATSAAATEVQRTKRWARTTGRIRRIQPLSASGSTDRFGAGYRATTPIGSYGFPSCGPAGSGERGGASTVIVG
jgi:hypothetical protein